MLPTSLLCVGLSHRRAPLELREQLSCTASALMAGASGPPDGLHELAVLSTCHRLELYAHASGEPSEMARRLTNWLAAAKDIKAVALMPHLELYDGLAAADHLCRVAAGLDSVVLGEPQILGQVSDAYAAARECGGSGEVLAAIFRTAVQAGKRARTETAISTQPASVSSVAIALAAEAAPDLRRRHALVIGLGEMGRQTVKALRLRGVGQIDVANRTRSRAEAVARQTKGRAYQLDELDEALVQADVVFSSTAAPGPIISPALVQQAMAGRTGRGLILVDIAVPRDVDPAVGQIPGVRLFDVDDLRSTLDEGLEMRRRAIPDVERIIAEEMSRLETELHQLAVRPLLVELRQQAESIRQRELQRALRRLGEVDPELQNQLDLLSLSLVKKLLHEPTVRLKALAANDDAAAYAATIRHLFGLPE